MKRYVVEKERALHKGEMKLVCAGGGPEGWDFTYDFDSARVSYYTNVGPGNLELYGELEYDLLPPDLTGGRIGFYYKISF